jgi:hypothetical protein
MGQFRAGISDKAFRLGALALASGASVAWSGDAHANLITQIFNFPGTSTGGITLGAGGAGGGAQYSWESGAATSYYLGQTDPATFVGTGTSPKITDLSPGTVIGPASGFLDTATLDSNGNQAKLDYGLWKDGGYMGLQFDIEPSSTDYGYAQLTWDSGDPGVTIAVTYDDSGAPVTIPSVPEPATLGVLAMGAAGVLAVRRRRGARA